MRQITGYMRAFGMNDAEIDILVRRNPARIVDAAVTALA
jgi:hypothetical protein